MDEFQSAKPRKTLSAEQKAAFVLLMFLGLGGVFLGFKSFGANIRRPFEEQLARAPAGFLTQEQQEEKEVEESKKRDSDADGLSDYDEQYVYKTSAFLKDTDSDGVDDQTEILSGNDPNCPKDKTCAGPPVGSETATTSSSSAGTGLQASSPVFATAASPFQSEQDIVNFLMVLPPDQIRQLLQQSGISAEELQKLSDDELEQLLSDAIEIAKKQGQFQAILDNSGAIGPSSTP